MWGRIAAVIRKEFIQILRDRRTLATMFLIPVVQLVLLGYAATTDVDNIATVVLDQDRSPESRELVETYRASGYFAISHWVESEEELAKLIDSGRARAGMIIPPNYGQYLVENRGPEIAFIIDGSDPNIAKAALSAAESVGRAKSVEIVEEILDRRGLRPEKGLEVRPKVWYNPELASANFMIPGILAVILQMLTTMLTALAIVREREQGTIEQLIVTPIQPLELVLGKVAPYVAIAFLDLLAILVLGSVLFQVPVRGSLPLLLALSALSLLTSLGMGLFISTVSRSQQEAMLLTYFMLMPSIFLSGFMFPVAAMPLVLRYVSYAIPLTYLLIITRGIILKGVGLEVLGEQVIILTVFGVVILLLAASRFQKRLE